MAQSLSDKSVLPCVPGTRASWSQYPPLSSSQTSCAQHMHSAWEGRIITQTGHCLSLFPKGRVSIREGTEGVKVECAGIQSPWTSCQMGLFLQFPLCNCWRREDAAPTLHLPGVHPPACLWSQCRCWPESMKRLHLRLWKVWLYCTQPHSHFVLGPKPQEDVFWFTPSLQLCFLVCSKCLFGD